MNCTVRGGILLAIFFSFTSLSQADQVYWDGTATSWNTLASWSTSPTAATPNPLTIPGALDIVNLTASTATVAQTINLDADQAVLGILTNANNRFVTTIRGGNGNRVLSLGGSGLTHTGAGGLTIGSTTANQQANLLLTSAQTWTSSAAGTNQAAIVILNGVSIASGGNQTLTLTGINTGARIDGVMEDAVDGSKLSILKTGTSATSVWTLNGLNTYSGGNTVTTGILSFAQAANGGEASSLGKSSNAATNLQLANGTTLRYVGSSAGLTDRKILSTAANDGEGLTLDASGTGTINFTNPDAINYQTANQARTLTFAGTSIVENVFAGNIVNNGTGTTSVTKNGAGRWHLTGNNSYSGITTINGGILGVLSLGNGGQVGNLGNASSDPANILLNNGALQYRGAGESTDRNFTVNGNMGAIDSSGSGPITFTNLASPAWGTANVYRTLVLGGTNTGDNIFSGTLSDNGTSAIGLYKAGTGKWILASAQNFTGVFTVAEGILQSTVATNGFGKNQIRLAGGIVALRADANTTFSNDLGAYPVTLSASSTIDVGQITTAAANTNISLGTVSLPGAFTLNTTGSSGLSLSLGAITGSTAADKVIANSIAAPGRLVVPSYTETDATARKLTFDGPGTTVAGNITQNGTNALTLTKAGTGTLILNPGSNYTGPTQVTSGTLLYNANDALPNASELQILGGTVDMGTNRSDTVRNVVLRNNSSIIGAGSVLTTTNYSTLESGTLSVQLAGSTGVVKRESGTAMITVPQSYTGTTSVERGILKLGSNDVLPTTTTLELEGGTVDLGVNQTHHVYNVTSDHLSTANTYNRLVGSGSVLISNNYDFDEGIIDVELSGPASLRADGSRPLTINVKATYTGTTTVSGILELGNSDVLPDTELIVSSGSLRLGADRTETVRKVTIKDGAITGTGSSTLTSTESFNVEGGGTNVILAGNVPLIKSGPRSTDLYRANIYTGPSSVNAGSLVLHDAQALGTSGQVTVATNASLILSDNITVTGVTATIAGPGDGTATKFGALATSYGPNTSTWTGDIILNGTTARLGAETNSTFKVAGKVQTGNGQDLYLNGDFRDSGIVEFSAPSGTNIYVGNTFVGSGTLRIGADNTLPTSTIVDLHWTLSSTFPATFDLNGFNQTIGGLKNGAGTNVAVVTTNSANTLKTLTINSTTNSSYSGLITGAFTALTKSGSATQTLSGANTYGGSTLITGGALALAGNGSIANSPVIQVNAGATFDASGRTTHLTLGTAQLLKGSGSVIGPINVAGTVAPGNSPGVLTITDDVTFTSSSNFQWELTADTTANPGTSWDRLAINNGDLSIASGAILQPLFSGATSGPTPNSFWSNQQRWSNVIAFTNSNLLPGNPSLFTIDNLAWSGLGYFSTEVSPSNSGIDLVWNVQAIPEPGQLSAAAVVLLLLVARRFKNRHALKANLLS